MTASPPSAEITVRVLLFARFAELVGRESYRVTLPAPATVGDVVAAFRREAVGAAALPARPLCARNQSQALPEEPVADGDDIALLPPLSGG